jgi:hypothetical protein
VNAHVLVSFLETVVFADKVQIIATNDNGALHLHLTNDSSENSSTDRAHSGEGAFLVDVVAGDCLKYNNCLLVYDLSNLIDDVDGSLFRKG